MLFSLGYTINNRPVVPQNAPGQIHPAVELHAGVAGQDQEFTEHSDYLSRRREKVATSSFTSPRLSAVSKTGLFLPLKASDIVG